MNIEQAFRKYVAQRNFVKLCIISKYYLQHLEIKKNGYYIAQLAFLFIDKNCRRFNNKVLELANAHGFHATSHLSTARDQFLITVLKNTVDRKFENKVKNLMEIYGVRSIYDF